MRTLARCALRAYPPYFRVRYGDELEALVEDTGSSPRAAVDLALGAARAWLRPSFPSADAKGRRVQASVATIWTSWCVGFLVVPAVNKAVLDPPTHAASSSVHVLLDAAVGLFVLGWAIALAGAVPIVIASLLPAVRRGQWRTLRPLVPAAVLALAETVGLILIAVLHPGASAHPSVPAKVGIALWLVGLVALTCAMGAGPAATLTRLAPASGTLRVPFGLAVLLALTLTAATGCCAAAAAMAHGALLNNVALTWVVIAVAAGSSLAAVTSAARGTQARLAA